MPRCGVNPALGGAAEGQPMADSDAPEEGADVTSIWTVTDPNDLVYSEVLEILFGPDSDNMAA